MSKRLLWKASCLVFVFSFWQILKLSSCLYCRDTVNVPLSESLHVPVKFHHLPSEQPDSTNADMEEKNS